MMYKIGEMIRTKKTHACGNDQWIVVRIGADIKLKCSQCNREIMMKKVDLDKKVAK